MLDTGGGPSFKKGVMKEGCVVTLYSDDECKKGIGEITEATTMSCHAPRILGQGKKVRSFSVHCQ